MTYVPAVGDRVRLARDLGGHLKAGRLGVVNEIDPPREDGKPAELNIHILIPWIREEAPANNGAWNGRDGSNAIALSQFTQNPQIPVSADEVEFIDNIMTGGS